MPVVLFKLGGNGIVLTGLAESADIVDQVSILDLAVVIAVAIIRPCCDTGSTCADKGGRGPEAYVGQGNHVDIFLEYTLDGCLDIAGQHKVESQRALPGCGVLELRIHQGDGRQVKTCSGSIVAGRINLLEDGVAVVTDCRDIL